MAEVPGELDVDQERAVALRQQLAPGRSFRLALRGIPLEPALQHPQRIPSQRPRHGHAAQLVKHAAATGSLLVSRCHSFLGLVISVPHRQCAAIGG